LTVTHDQTLPSQSGVKLPAALWENSREFEWVSSLPRAKVSGPGHRVEMLEGHMAWRSIWHKLRLASEGYDMNGQMWRMCVESTYRAVIREAGVEMYYTGLG